MLQTTTASKPDINDLLDDLFANAALQKSFGDDPVKVMQGYSLSEAQKEALLAGDSDALLSLGLSERHTRQMRISW